MNIFLMGSRQTSKLAEFEKFAAAANNGVRVSVVGRPQPLELSDETAGVVLFDDGRLSSAEWIASVREQTRYLSVPVIAVASRSDRETR